MEFIFHPSSYDAPGLEAETAELLRRCLEARSRQVLPGMWKVTDRLNARAARGPGREKRRTRYRVYGVLLIALGIFALVPGLMEPRIPSLILTGGLAVLVGILNIGLVSGGTSPAPSASCQREAAELLRQRRETDWEALQAEVRFDGAGMTVTVQGEHTVFAYEALQGVYESQRLWLVVYDGKLAQLLQKKDLTAGAAEAFLPNLQEKISH